MINEILIVIGMPILRSVGGWANVALKDGVISKFEISKLGETILRTSIISALIYFGAEGYGIDADVIATTASAIILDLIVSKKSKV